MNCGSTNNDLIGLLHAAERRDPRIRIFHRPNEGIVTATNNAVEVARGQFLAFMDSGDEIAPDALAEIALYLFDHPETDVLYSDNDKIDVDGRRYDPCFKPDWSPELLLSYDYLNPLVAIRKSLFTSIGGLRPGMDGSQNYDLVLRGTECARHVGHICLILYHQRGVPGSGATGGHSDSQALEMKRQALADALARRRYSGSPYVADWAAPNEKVAYYYEFPDCGPSVSILLLTKFRVDLLRNCIESLTKTTYNNYEVIVIDHEADSPDMLAYLGELPYRRMTISTPGEIFNFSKIYNTASARVISDYLLFLNDDTEVIDARWLSYMVGYAQMENVGAVGARLLYPDGRVQHEGVVPAVILGKWPCDCMKLADQEDFGYMLFNKVPRNCSAVTAACMLTPSKLFHEIGGFDERDFPIQFNDVDYCLRLIEKGYRIVQCPQVELIHHEMVTRSKQHDLRENLAYAIKYRGIKDPYYNPNLDLGPPTHFSIKPRKMVSNGPRCIKTVAFSHNLNDCEGAPLIQHHIVTALKQAGVIDPVVVSPLDGPVKEYYLDHGVPVIVQDLLGTALDKSFRDMVDCLQKLVAEFGAELTYANTLQTWYAIAASQSAQLPSVWAVHESEPWENYFSFLPSKFAKRALESFAYPYRVIFHSYSTMRRFEPLNSRHNYTVINNGLVLESMQKLLLGTGTRKDARKTLGIADDETMIFLLGTVCERKGQHDLPLAIARMPETLLKRARCFIVGDRQTERYSAQLHNILRELPAGVQQRIRVIPETTQTGDYWKAADIFVCTSRLESYPVVVQEAMYFGLPIITTPVFGIAEQVMEKVNALFYEPGDIQGLAGCLMSLLSPIDLREKLASNSFRVLESLTSHKETVVKYAEVIREAFLSRGGLKR